MCKLRIKTEWIGLRKNLGKEVNKQRQLCQQWQFWVKLPKRCIFCAYYASSHYMAGEGLYVKEEVGSWQTDRDRERGENVKEEEEEYK